MNESCPASVLVDFLKVDHKFTGIMLRICHDLGAKQCDYMIRNDLGRFILEVCIVDTKIRVEPVNFSGDEFARDEALNDKLARDRWRSCDMRRYEPCWRLLARPTRVALLCL